MGTEAHKSVVEIDLQDIQGTGLSVSEAGVFLRQLREVTERVDESLPGIWQKISTSLLRPELPFPLHQLMYYSTYKRWNVQKLGPEPVWFPSMELARNSNLGRLMEAHGKKLLGSSYRNPLESFSAFQKWSALHPEGYVQLALEQMNVYFHEQPRSFLDKTDDNIPGGVWLPGAVLNAAECCLAPNLKLGKTDDSPAIVWKDEGADDLPAKILSLAELRARVNRVANALVALGFQRGDTIGIDMPMTIYAVIVYLAIVLAGMVVVSIADSFVGAEIATRCRVSQAKAMFTQDHILRGGKRLPLYRFQPMSPKDRVTASLFVSRVVEADAPRAIVIPADGDSLAVQLRDGDLSYEHFVLYANKVSRPEEFKAVAVRGEEFCNILFSSGTTGDPKAIPWTHISPLRCGVDGFGHQDIRVGDIVAWPTNLGWMMGPFLIYASLLNGAAIALYNGSPLGRGYGRFIQDAGVTMQGTVPSLVKTWRNSNCMEGLNWSTLRCFSSTGEASSADDDLWLMSRVSYKCPVLECCGGTELAAAYIGGSFFQPQALAAFSTPSMSNSLVLLDDYGNAYPDDKPCIGEVGLIAVSFGASSTLLNADHYKVYFQGMPLFKGKRLRRHGDIFERLPGGYYKAHGRSDDTMNLGGIKASAIEIERVCNSAHERVLETAAIALSPPGGGPEKLTIMVVLREGPSISLDVLKKAFSSAIYTNLNPLFKVSHVEVVPEFPRTASNKLLRRVLRAQLVQQQKITSKL